MRVIPLAILFLMAAAAATAERPDTLDLVLETHRAAVTDDPTIGPVNSIQVDVLIEEPTFSLTATYVANRDGEMRIDLYDGETRVFSEGLGKQGGWQWYGGESQTEPVSAAGQAALERGIVGNLYQLYERPGLGYALSYQGRVEEQGQQHWKVLSEAPDGFREVFYINVDTGFIDRKFEVSALHPDQDSRERPSITHLQDYQVRGGQYFAFRMEKRDAESGDLLQKTTVADLRVNTATGALEAPLAQN